MAREIPPLVAVVNHSGALIYVWADGRSAERLYNGAFGRFTFRATARADYAAIFPEAPTRAD